MESPFSTMHKALLVAALAVSLISACSRDGNPDAVKSSSAPTAADIDSRSKVIGVQPGAPQPEPATTTSSAKSDISADAQSKSMPMPGQANDHSTLSSTAPQKSPAKK